MEKWITNWRINFRKDFSDKEGKQERRKIADFFFKSSDSVLSLEGTDIRLYGEICWDEGNIKAIETSRIKSISRYYRTFNKDDTIILKPFSFTILDSNGEKQENRIERPGYFLVQTENCSIYRIWLADINLSQKLLFCSFLSCDFPN